VAKLAIEEGSGSPQRSQSGGVIRWIPIQQGLQTAPSSGRKSVAPHAAQGGSKSFERMRFVKARATLKGCPHN
jgi:hypothetical protein